MCRLGELSFQLLEYRGAPVELDLAALQPLCRSLEVQAPTIVLSIDTHTRLGSDHPGSLGSDLGPLQQLVQAHPGGEAGAGAPNSSGSLGGAHSGVAQPALGVVRDWLESAVRQLAAPGASLLRRVALQAGWPASAHPAQQPRPAPAGKWA